MTEAQIARFRKVAEADPALHLVDADQPSELVAQRLVTRCVETLATRQTRRGWRL